MHFRLPVRLISILSIFSPNSSHIGTQGRENSNVPESLKQGRTDYLSQHQMHRCSQYTQPADLIYFLLQPFIGKLLYLSLMLFFVPNILLCIQLLNYV